MSNINIKPMKEPNKVINYWKKEKFAVLCIVVFGLAYNISMVRGPVYQGRLIDSIAQGSDETLRAGANFMAVIAMIQIFRYFKRFYIRRFANRTGAVMRFMIYNNIMNMKKEELDKESAGNLTTRAVSDVELCVEGMRKFTTEVFDTGVMMAAYFVYMLSYDVKLTVSSIIFVPAAMVLAEKLKTVIYRYSTDYRTKSSEVAELTYNAVENAMLYRISGIEEQNRLNYRNELDDLKTKAIQANLLENSMHPIYNAIAMMGIVTVIYFAGLKVIEGIWTIGTFSAYVAMFGDLALKASKAAKLFNSVQKSQISWNRIRTFLTDCREHDDKVWTDNDKISLVVDNLSFSYPGSKEDIIQNICFEAGQGEIVGITGPVACGKSTLGLSFLGLYPYSGSIKINGRELNCMSENERSSIISYMGHNTELMTDTIYNNITLGSTGSIHEVIMDVCFGTDMDEMPKGQDTMVGNRGVRLSGGQQSRLALARTLFNKNSIIILDDPFASVDMKTEERIILNLRTNYKDSLILIISHRLSIFEKTDKVLFMESGKETMVMNHYELLEKSPLYREIYNLQQNAGDEDEI
ncbi:MAG: ABC transporter ATP-binding protein [Sedimentibacter sp.]|uniref:ABC transporter ATP-binding protein n=1 Tax=Sedimentibacter sp. TaxID=1960295 RepID=UPI003158C7D1